MNEVPEDRLKVMLNVRLTEPENETFESLARQLQTTRARLLRKMIREFIGQGPDPLQQDERAMEQAAYQLSCVGRNLNQLMRAIHSGKLPAAAELQTVLSALQIHLKQIGTELRGMVDRSYDRRVQETVLP